MIPVINARFIFICRRSALSGIATMSGGIDSSISFAFAVHRSAFALREYNQIFVTFHLYVTPFAFMHDFTQFDAFERCREFARGIAVHLNSGTFSHDPVLTTALRKTVLSIYSNFGEGFERDGNREFAQFVSIAKGSIGETLAQLIYALDFGYLKQETFPTLMNSVKPQQDVWGD